MNDMIGRIGMGHRCIGAKNRPLGPDSSSGGGGVAQHCAPRFSRGESCVLGMYRRSGTWYCTCHREDKHI